MLLADKCYLSEIYSAIQGEGPLVGIRQLFVRFSACDLRCKWCDTPESLVRTEVCSIEKEPGLRLYETINNPITSNSLISLLKNLNNVKHHSISLTGGEPLLQSDFLCSSLSQLKDELGTEVYLESGGHRPDELKKVIEYIDYVSMDFKLPSSSETGDLWDKHAEFLKISLNAKKNVWVKIVITKNTLLEEIVKSVELIKTINDQNEKIEVFLQPVTEINNIFPPNENALLSIQAELLKLYPYVRVVPQVHKLIGQR